jgi:hypothetical protein
MTHDHERNSIMVIIRLRTRDYYANFLTISQLPYQKLSARKSEKDNVIHRALEQY